MPRNCVIALLLLIAINLTAWINIKQKPLYRASSAVIVETVSPDILTERDIKKSKEAYYFAYKTCMETQREAIKSRRIAYQVIKNLGLGDKEAFNGAKISAETLLKKLKVDNVKGTGIIRINIEDEDSEEASRIANEFARVYVNSDLSRIGANNARMQDFADIPAEPVRPDKKLSIMLFMISGIISGVIIIFFRKPNNITVKDSKDIEDLLQFPILGSVPKIEPDGRNVMSKIDVDRIVEKDSLCMASEAYRSIRTKLLFSSNNSGSIAKSLVITSSAPKEGKTINAVNLAIMIANSGENVLLVDVNMKRPRVHSVFNMNNEAGFANYLSGEADFDSIIKYPEIDNLYIITSGCASCKTVEAISLKNMRLFLEKAGTAFSKVIFDAPTVAFIAEAAALLSMCDGVMLIVDGNKSTRGLLNKSKELLRKRDANIIGVVLNNVSF